jgi:hypothetical protein
LRLRGGGGLRRLDLKKEIFINIYTSEELIIFSFRQLFWYPYLDSFSGVILLCLRSLWCFFFFLFFSGGGERLSLEMGDSAGGGGGGGSTTGSDLSLCRFEDFLDFLPDRYPPESLSDESDSLLYFFFDFFFRDDLDETSSMSEMELALESAADFVFFLSFFAFLLFLLRPWAWPQLSSRS